MIIVPVKEGENIEKALKKFKRKFEKTGVVKELRKIFLKNLVVSRNFRKFVAENLLLVAIYDD